MREQSRRASPATVKRPEGAAELEARLDAYLAELEADSEDEDPTTPLESGQLSFQIPAAPPSTGWTSSPTGTPKETATLRSCALTLRPC